MPTQEDIIHDILAKKELSGIEHSFVNTMLDKELRKRPKIKLEALSPRSAAYKDIIKAVRAVLRRNVGLFEGDPRHREVLLAELRQSAPGQHEEIVEHILATHASTRERLPFYDRVYAPIFTAVGKPRVVLDIGCGLNPLAYPDPEAIVIGVDIDRNLCAAVQDYFSITGREGECKVADVRGTEFFKSMPKADVAFVFKLLDLIDDKDHRRSEKLLTSLPARWLVVSFPTLKISGKPMRVPRRQWFERLLARLGYAYTTFMIPNELFYVVKKQ